MPSMPTRAERTGPALAGLPGAPAPGGRLTEDRAVQARQGLAWDDGDSTKSVGALFMYSCDTPDQAG